MRNRCFLAFGVAFLVSFLVVDVQARPGGKRGGGPQVGGARPGNFRPGDARPGGQIGQQGIRNPGGKLQSLTGGNVAGNLKNGNFQNKVSQLKTNFTPANQPFSPAWYANHPGAWQYTRPHADAWAVATFGAAATWLGIAATTGGYAAEAESVYTSDAPAESDAPSDEQPNDNTAQQQSAQAGEFLPLGVFALAPQSEKDASALVQLAVNQQGVVRGNYYDVLTGEDQPVAGTFDKKTQRATFQAGPGGNVTFEASLASLTQPSGAVTLRFQNGQTRKWTLARFDDKAPQAN